jgi:CheY-like chemotaxis protein
VNRPLEILLAEDDHANQLLATALLQQLGHKVHIVENGRLAVEAAETARFDLIFMDWQMPEMSGLDAAREIRAREARAAGANGQPQRVPIVAMTAQTMRGDAQACLAAGMDAYLAKPIRRVELVEAMATALRKRAAEAQPLAGVEAGGGRSA